MAGVMMFLSGAGIAVVPMVLPGQWGIPGALAVITCLVVVLAPWLSLPICLVGGLVASVYLAPGEVYLTVAIHVALVLICGLALAIRAVVDPGVLWLPRSPANWPMAGLSLVIVIGTCLGLLWGNDSARAITALYHLGVVPMYYFLAMLTLRKHSDRRRAAFAYVLVIGLITVVSFTMPGRHGGLMSLLALGVVIPLAGQTEGLRAIGWTLLGAVLAGDVVLATYRAVWAAGAVVVLLLVVFGGPVYRRGLARVFAMGTFAFFLLSALGVFAARWGSVADYAWESPGYRLSESLIGWQAVANHPFLGEGVGQASAPVVVPLLGVATVGPVYHAYYLTVGANIGLIGLMTMGWALTRLLRFGLQCRDQLPQMFAILTIGCLIFASAAAPINGHWELGVLPALIWLTRPSGEVNHAFDLRDRGHVQLRR